jgi:glycerol kinase
MQFQSDILQVPVVRPSVAETTALGAAYGAGLAVGYWSTIGDLKCNWVKDGEWLPLIEKSCVDQLYSRWKKAVEKTFNWVD